MRIMLCRLIHDSTQVLARYTGPLLTAKDKILSPSVEDRLQMFGRCVNG